MLAAFFTIYVGSYCAVCLNREVRFVNDTYRVVSMHNAVISDDVSFAAYKPLIWLDELTLGPSDLNQKPE